MVQSYSNLVERIAQVSGLAAEEIHRRVEAKRAKLSGLISQEGAAQIVAAELGINFDQQKVKANELAGMKRVHIVGKIIQMFPVREYNKNGKQGKIGSFILADETGNVRTVMWDTNHIKLIEEGKIKEGDVVEITSGMMRNAELHLSGLSDIQLSTQQMGAVKVEQAVLEKSLAELKIGERAKVRAVIVQIFEPKFFETCSVCNTRLTLGADGSICPAHGKVLPNKRALLSAVLDDGQENIRAVLFNEQIEKILGPVEQFASKREELLGKEAYFSGNVRQNKLFGNPEFFVQDLEEINVEELIARLEKR